MKDRICVLSVKKKKVFISFCLLGVKNKKIIFLLLYPLLKYILKRFRTANICFTTMKTCAAYTCCFTD